MQAISDNLGLPGLGSSKFNLKIGKISSILQPVNSQFDQLLWSLSKYRFKSGNYQQNY